MRINATDERGESMQEVDAKTLEPEAQEMLLTPCQAAGILQCNRKTVIRLAKQGRLPAINISSSKKQHRFRFRRSDLLGGPPGIAQPEADGDSPTGQLAEV